MDLLDSTVAYLLEGLSWPLLPSAYWFSAFTQGHLLLIGLRAETWTQAVPIGNQPGVLGQGRCLGYQLPGSSRVFQSSFTSTSLPTGVEQQTSEEKAFGDFDISGPDTPYGMMNFTYEPREFDRLVALSRYNVLNNVDTVRHALKLALDRRQAGERAGG